ncbi:nucleotide exchange factor GrpE [Deltaproteobacteria bacterium Smac51]|nr:nucleotide exchange factor GrpE [Deltaproteobacteria bacterium Smac51]
MTEEKVTSAPEAENESVEETAPESEKNWAEEAHKFQDLYLRCAAETENMRRRFQKEKEEQARYAGEKIVKGMIPVLDNLILALSYVKADSPAEAQSLAEGVRMTVKGFQDVLSDNGLKSVPSKRGQVFDPNLHEALGQIPETEIPPGTISQLIQRGYTLSDRLIRPAKVMVAKAPDQN